MKRAAPRAIDTTTEQSRLIARTVVETTQARAVGIKYAADLLGISESVVRRMVRHNELPTLRFGQRVVIPLALLDDWIAKNSTPVVERHAS